MTNGEIRQQGSEYIVDFKYRPNLVEQIKRITGRRWDYREKIWKVPSSSLAELKTFAIRNRISFNTGTIDQQQESYVPDTVPELPELSDDIKIPLRRELFPFQKNGVAYALQKKRVIIGDQPGLGKAQPLHSKIATPNGWVKMGDIKKGDPIFGSDGKVYEVNGVFPQGDRQVYNIEFNDGFMVYCDEEHLWSVRDVNRRRRGTGWTVKTTQELIESGLKYRENVLRKSQGRKQILKWEIPITKPVEYPQQDQYIHPYIFGMLLGDGCLSATGRNKRIAISIPETEIESVARITSLLPEGIKLYKNSHPSCPQYYFTQTKTTGANPVFKEIEALGLNVRGHDKFIPKKYLTGAVWQRIEVLRGLLDSDGSCARNRVTFHSKSPGLVLNICELVQSLGGQAIIKTYDRSKDGKGLEFQINIRVNFNPFHLKRKAEQWKLAKRNYASRYIESIIPVGPMPTQCISVTAPNSLYLTDHYTVTHNTSQAFATIIAADAFPCLIICPASLKINWQREIDQYTYKKAMILSDAVKNNFFMYHGAGLADFFIVNFESLKKYFVEKIDDPGKGKPLRLNHIHFKEWAVNFFKSVIIDESHRVKSIKVQQTKFTKGICTGKEWILALTGTPVINKPKDLISQLGIIDQFKEFGGYGAFVNRYCAGPKEASNLKELNYRLNTTCFYRRDKSDVMKDLPPKTRQVVMCEISTRKEYRDAQKNLEEYLRLYKEATDEQIRKSMKGEVMVRIGILKNISARGKFKEVVEFIDDMIEQGEKLVLFGHLREVLGKFKEHYPSAVSITGEDSASQRQFAVDQFQNNPDCKLIICSIQAAGVGLTLTASSQVAFIELGWHPAIHDQCEDRCHRIGQNDNVTCTYFLGKDTIDEWVYGIINEKRSMTNQVTGASDDVQENVIDRVWTLFNQEK